MNMELKRDLLEHLKKWKDSPNHKPILLKGARQVDKSWLAKEIGKDFPGFIEINFEKRPELSSFFEGNLDPHQIAKNIGNYFGIKISPGESLLFLDEIQICPRAIQSLRYFYEDFPELHVISAGSLLEFELQNLSVPVGMWAGLVYFIYIPSPLPNTWRLWVRVTSGSC
jgi:uncharacterized protein